MACFARPFHVVQVILSDNSDIYEVRGRGLERRIASSNNVVDASRLADQLNDCACAFELAGAENNFELSWEVA